LNEARSLLVSYKEARKTGIPSALATVVRVTGSSYRQPGAKLLVTGTGELTGSVSGGCLERDLVRQALLAIENSTPALVRYDSRADADEAEWNLPVTTIGSGCEGIVEIFIDPDPVKHLAALESACVERKKGEHVLYLPDGSVFKDILSPPVPLFIFGAGPDAVPMARLAGEIGWETTVVDLRSSLPVPRRLFGKIARIVSCAPDQVAGRIEIGPDSVLFVMTHNYHHDLAVLRLVIDLPVLYLGLLGPRSRSEKLLSELETATTGKKPLHFPMGLDIGGDTPQAVALSALAEAQAVLNGKKGGFLALRKGSIHR
jgi:xanthine/CO dehydrogenase XdhC/CoxF family maturation factor